MEQKAAEKISDIESDITAVKAKTRLALWEEIGRRMQEGASGLESADLRRMVQNYCDLIGAEPESRESAHWRRLCLYLHLDLSNSKT